MSTTTEILAESERHLNNSMDTPAELREKLAQSERECIDLLAKSQKAFAVAVVLQWELDAARADVQRLRSYLDGCRRHFERYNDYSMAAYCAEALREQEQKP